MVSIDILHNFGKNHNYGLTTSVKVEKMGILKIDLHVTLTNIFYWYSVVVMAIIILMYYA